MNGKYSVKCEDYYIMYVFKKIKNRLSTCGSLISNEMMNIYNIMG